MKITLYTKENCSLCDDVKAELQTLADTYPHTLQEVDITQDDALFAEYRYTIPVLAYGDEQLAAPISRQGLIDWLEGL